MSGGNLLCEYCDHPLGLFKRKRMCPGCSRWFCTSCLPRDYQFQASNLRLGRNPLGPTPICQRCSILAIDNVTKEHLMELRVKDLRQYLEAKRIPTAGCREKSELVDLVFSHCCSDAFLRQQAENQRRLRELTRRKEAEEQWEERHGRSQNDINSPDSVGSGRRFNSRVASSSPETSSGADDPDEVSIGEEIQIDPPNSQPSSASRLDRDNADLGAAAAENDAWRPVYEVVDVEFSNREGGGAGCRDSAGDRMDTGANGGDIPSPTTNGAPHAPSAPVAPPSYDEVMASTSSSSNGVHPASAAGAPETIDLTQSSETDDAIEVEAAPTSASRTRGANTLISEATTASTTTATTTASSSNGTSSTTASAAGSGTGGGGGTATSASTASSTLHPPHVSNASSATNSGTDSLSSSPSRFAGRRRIRLEELERPEDIKELTPRQLKEILTANFVAYKGCCERWELEDRVKRLWNEYRVNQEVLRQTYEREENRNGSGNCDGGGANASVSADPASSGSSGASSTTKTTTTSTSHPHHHPDVDSQLCKICWDAVIDCVLLECGHMVTCTDCGRRMAECPICRQYVVRAVHVFRA